MFVSGNRGNCEVFIAVSSITQPIDLTAPASTTSSPHFPIQLTGANITSFPGHVVLQVQRDAPGHPALAKHTDRWDADQLPRRMRHAEGLPACLRTGVGVEVCSARADFSLRAWTSR